MLNSGELKYSYAHKLTHTDPFTCSLQTSRHMDIWKVFTWVYTLRTFGRSRTSIWFLHKEQTNTFNDSVNIVVVVAAMAACCWRWWLMVMLPLLKLLMLLLRLLQVIMVLLLMVARLVQVSWHYIRVYVCVYVYVCVCMACVEDFGQMANRSKLLPQQWHTMNSEEQTNINGSCRIAGGLGEKESIFTFFSNNILRVLEFLRKIVLLKF